MFNKYYNLYDINKKNYIYFGGENLEQISRTLKISEKDNINEIIEKYNTLFKSYKKYYDLHRLRNKFLLQQIETEIKKKLSDLYTTHYKKYKLKEPLLQKKLDLQNFKSSYDNKTYFLPYIKEQIEQIFTNILQANTPYKKDLTYTQEEITAHKESVIDKINKFTTYEEAYEYYLYIEILYFCHKILIENKFTMLSEQVRRMKCPLTDLIFVPQITFTKPKYIKFYIKIFTTLYNTYTLKTPKQIINSFMTFTPTNNYEELKHTIVRNITDTEYTNDGEIKKPNFRNVLHGVINQSITLAKKITLEEYIEILKTELLKEYNKFKQFKPSGSMTEYIHYSIINKLSNQTDLNEIKKTYEQVFQYHIDEYKRLLLLQEIDKRWLDLYKYFIITNHNALYIIELANIDNEYLDLTNETRSYKYHYDNNFMKVSSNFLFGFGASFKRKFFPTEHDKLIQEYLIKIYNKYLHHYNLPQIPIEKLQYYEINKFLINLPYYKLYYLVICLFIFNNYDFEQTITDIIEHNNKYLQISDITQQNVNFYLHIITFIRNELLSGNKSYKLPDKTLEAKNKLLYHISIMIHIDKFLNISTDKYLPSEKLTNINPFCYGRTTIMLEKYNFESYPFYRTYCETIQLNEKIAFNTSINQAINFYMGHSTQTLVSGLIILNDNDNTQELPTQYYHVEREYGFSDNDELIGIIEIDLIDGNFKSKYIIFIILYDDKTSAIVLFSHRGRDYETGSITELFSTFTKELHAIIIDYGASIFRSKIIPNILLVVPAANTKQLEPMLRKKNNQGYRRKNKKERPLFYDFKTELTPVDITLQYPVNTLKLTSDCKLIIEESKDFDVEESKKFGVEICEKNILL